VTQAPPLAAPALAGAYLISETGPAQRTPWMVAVCTSEEAVQRVIGQRVREIQQGALHPVTYGALETTTEGDFITVTLPRKEACAAEADDDAPYRWSTERREVIGTSEMPAEALYLLYASSEVPGAAESSPWLVAVCASPEAAERTIRLQVERQTLTGPRRVTTGPLRVFGTAAFRVHSLSVSPAGGEGGPVTCHWSVERRSALNAVPRPVSVGSGA